MSNKTKKQLLLNLPYFIAGLVCTNLGEAWRIAEGADMSEKLLGFLSALGAAFSNPMPSLHPMDLLIGVCCGAGLRLAVYLKGKNAKKYRHGMEYGSARWGTQKDIEPFEDPVFANNVILTRTERLMMGNRPKNPANARNKNVLVVGGSGSGKTRFWLKPNLLQCHSSYVVTDPKGDIVIDCGQALLKNGYSIRIFNTINFRKSMHYNPFAYIHSEKEKLSERRFRPGGESCLLHSQVQAISAAGYFLRSPAGAHVGSMTQNRSLESHRLIGRTSYRRTNLWRFLLQLHRHCLFSHSCSCFCPVWRSCSACLRKEGGGSCRVSLNRSQIGSRA